MAAVSNADKWREHVWKGYPALDYTNPVDAVAASEVLKVERHFEKSKERVNLIAKRHLQKMRLDPASFVDAYPLDLEKDALCITYNDDRKQVRVVEDVRLKDAEDIKILEKYRVWDRLTHRVINPPPQPQPQPQPPPANGSWCTVL